MTSVVLSITALSKASAAAFTAEEVTRQLTLGELRLSPAPVIVRTVLSTRCDVLKIALQDPSDHAVLPLMLTLASLTRSGRIEVHDLASGRRTSVGRLRAALGIVDTVAATLAGIVAVIRLNITSRWLMRRAPMEFPARTGDKALYLKTNLMLGPKAGGSIGHIAGVANELFRRDAGLCVFAPEPPPMVDRRARYEEVPALRTFGAPIEINHFRFNSTCVKTPAATLSRDRFDYIYQRMSLGSVAGVTLSRRFGVPLVLEYNGSEVWIANHWGHKLRFPKLAERIESVCLRHAHRVVTVSQVLADELAARGVPRERIVWYPNCIDPEVFDPRLFEGERQMLREHLGIAPSDFVVLFLGTFGVWHGAEVLAEAACEMLSRGEAPDGPRLRFLFVGDGLRLPAVRETLAAHIERGDVLLTGLVPQQDAPKYLALGDVFVSPHRPSQDGSKFFGSPTKLFEYMAMSRPIVASALDQLADVLTPAVDVSALVPGFRAERGEVAVLTKPGSAADLSKALSALRADAGLRDSLATAARARALAHYTWAQHVQTIVDSLRRVTITTA